MNSKTKTWIIVTIVVCFIIVAISSAAVEREFWKQEKELNNMYTENLNSILENEE